MVLEHYAAIKLESLVTGIVLLKCKFAHITIHSYRYLSGKALVGPMPSSIGGLSSLIKFEIGHNFFNGTIPSSFGNLSSLTLLDFGGNQLVGPLPSSLGDLAALKTNSQSRT
jgi:Leucine-rich repeat (LRR) protein